MFVLMAYQLKPLNYSEFDSELFFVRRERPRLLTSACFLRGDKYIFRYSFDKKTY
jgi:hypothetical protein